MQAIRKVIIAALLVLPTACQSAAGVNRANGNATHWFAQPGEPKSGVNPEAAPKAAEETPVISLDEAPSIPDLATGKTRPPTPEELGDALGETGERWFYGPGLGRTALNVGTAVVFPPYILYLLGNAGLSLAGYEPLYVTDALPEAPREQVLSVYDGVTSVPGRLNALVAGREFIQK